METIIHKDSETWEKEIDKNANIQCNFQIGRNRNRNPSYLKIIIRYITLFAEPLQFKLLI